MSRKTASDALKSNQEYSTVIRFHALKIRRGSPLVGVQLPLPAPAQKPRPTRAPAIFDLRKTKPLIDPTEIACDALVTGRRRKPAQPGLLQSDLTGGQRPGSDDRGGSIM